MSNPVNGPGRGRALPPAQGAPTPPQLPLPAPRVHQQVAHLGLVNVGSPLWGGRQAAVPVAPANRLHALVPVARVHPPAVTPGLVPLQGAPINPLPFSRGTPPLIGDASRTVISERYHENAREYDASNRTVKLNGKTYKAVSSEMTDFSEYLLVSLGSSDGREAILLDPNTKCLQEVFENLETYLKDKVVEPAEEAVIVEHVMKFIIERVFTKSNCERELRTLLTGYSGKETVAGNPAISLDTFIAEGVGVCRHRSLLACYLLDRLIKKGILTGVVTHIRDVASGFVGRGAHAWATYQNHEARMHIDPMWECFEKDFCESKVMERLKHAYGKDVITRQIAKTENPFQIAQARHARSVKKVSPQGGNHGEGSSPSFQITVRHRLEWGEILAMVSKAQGWDPSRAAELTCDVANDPSGSTWIFDGRFDPEEWKFVVINQEHHTAEWELGENHTGPIGSVDINSLRFPEKTRFTVNHLAQYGETLAVVGEDQDWNPYRGIKLKCDLSDPEGRTWLFEGKLDTKKPFKIIILGQDENMFRWQKGDNMSYQSSVPTIDFLEFEEEVLFS